MTVFAAKSSRIKHTNMCTAVAAKVANIFLKCCFFCFMSPKDQIKMREITIWSSHAFFAK
jgi:hypothetical protein